MLKQLLENFVGVPVMLYLGSPESSQVVSVGLEANMELKYG